jgi:hypothetical protein
MRSRGAVAVAVAAIIAAAAVVVALATGPGAEPPAAGAASARVTLADHPQEVTSLVFLDLSQLLTLAEQTGMLRGARYRALRPDIAHIRAAGLDSTRGEADSTAELTLQIT